MEPTANSNGNIKGAELQRLLDLSNHWTWELDEQHRFVHCSIGVKKLLGYDPAELIGESPELLMFPEDIAEAKASFEARRKQPQDTCEKEVRLRHRDGHTVYCLSNSTITLNAAGDFCGIRGVEWDISKLMQARERMHESEERFRALADGSFDGVLVHIRGEVREANDAACRMWGYTREELIGMNAEQLAAPESHRKIREHVENQLETPYELELVRKDGTRFIAETIARNVTYQGKAARISGYRDLTRQREAEAELNEVQRQLQSVVDAAPIVLWSVDMDGVFTLSEGRGLAGLGLKPKQVVGISAYDIYKDQPDALIPIREALEGKTGVCNVSVGGREWTVNYVPRYDSEDKIVGVVGTSIDVTEFKKMEAERERLQSQLEHSQRMETVGTLAGGIAHDFNNILTPIIGYSELAISELSESHPVREDIEHVMKGALRAKELVEQILTFSRQSGRKRVPLYPHLILKETLSLLRASLPTSIEIQREINAQTSRILADPAQLHQIIMNLCTNAYHAMGDRGGVLTVGLKKVNLTEAECKAHPRLTPGSYVLLTVADTGKGMDAITLDRIFEPFFTTKDVGKGTGLGLSVVHGIVLDHGGEISVSSVLNTGSVFSVYLPVTDLRHDEEEPGAPQAENGGEHIMVVDDEPEVASIIEKMLRKLGYVVSSYTSSEEALQAFIDNPESFDLLVTDQIMPRLLGEELIVRVRDVRKDIPVLITTGFSERIDQSRLEALGVAELVLKPITGQQLAKTVSSLLHGVAPQ